MLLALYILFVCYLSIIDDFLPKLIGDISVLWLSFYFLLIVFLFTLAIRRDYRFITIWHSIIFGYVVIACISISWTEFHSYDLFTLKRLFARLFVPLIIAIIGYNLFRTRRNVSIFVINVCIVAFVLSIISIYQKMFAGNLFGGTVYITGMDRAAATFENPNSLAVFLVMAIPSIVYTIEKRLIPISLGWAVIAAVMAGIMCTVSRKGLITMFITFALYFIFRKKFKLLILLGAVSIAILAVMSGYIAISDRFESKELQFQLQARAHAARLGLQLFLESPLYGQGYEGYYDNVGRLLHSPQKKFYSHNIYIEVLANYGLAGFIFFLLIFLYPLFVSIKTLRMKVKDPDTAHLRDMALISISVIVPFMLSGYFAGALFEQWFHLNLLYTNVLFMLAARSRVHLEKSTDRNFTNVMSSASTPCDTLYSNNFTCGRF